MRLFKDKAMHLDQASDLKLARITFGCRTGQFEIVQSCPGIIELVRNIIATMLCMFRRGQIVRRNTLRESRLCSSLQQRTEPELKREKQPPEP